MDFEEDVDNEGSTSSSLQSKQPEFKFKKDDVLMYRNGTIVIVVETLPWSDEYVLNDHTIGFGRQFTLPRECEYQLKYLQLKCGDIQGPYYDDSQSKRYYLQCLYYKTVSKRKTKQIKIKSGGYRTAYAASADTDIFRFAINRDGAKFWQSSADRTEHGIYEEMKVFICKSTS